MQKRVLGDGLAQDRDNFLLLRFIAAALVIYGHAYAITGGTGLPEIFSWLGWGTYAGSIGVDLFFVVSGFLVTGSFLRRNLVEGVWARVVRIVPAYACCVVLSAFLLGTVLTSLPFLEYVRAPATRTYVLRHLRFVPGLPQDLPGVFMGNPRRANVNGSLWTLPAEVRMYLWAALLRGTGVLERRWLCNVALAGLFVWGVFLPRRLPLVPILDYVRLSGMFALGACSYVNRDRVPLGWQWFVVLVLLTAVLRTTAVYPYVFGITETYFVFCFAYCTPWYGFNRMGDYSYGIYLWGFPTQQTVASHAPSLSPLLNAACSLPVAMLLAAMSWHLLEKPALMAKQWPARIRARGAEFGKIVR